MRLKYSSAMLLIAAGVVAAEEPAPQPGEYVVTPAHRIGAATSGFIPAPPRKR